MTVKSQLRPRLLKLGIGIDCSRVSPGSAKGVGIRLEARSHIVMKYAVQLIRIEMGVEPVEFYLADDFSTCWAVYDCLDSNSEIVMSLSPLEI